MTTKITNAIDALVEALREESPEQMTTFRLFVNCEERVIETSERTPAQLKATGISMRNLRGNFIRENNPVRHEGAQPRSCDERFVQLFCFLAKITLDDWPRINETSVMLRGGPEAETEKKAR